MNNWKEVSLKDYCKTQYGYTASATDTNTGVKFVRITDIVPDFMDWNKVPYCEISEKDFRKYKLNEGDIVAARTGATVGYAKQIRKGSPDAVFASYLVKLTPSEEVDKHFLGVLIESNVYREFIQIIAGGSAQPNANATDLTLFKFFLPPLPTQKRIASILSAYDDLIEVNNQRIKLLEETARELYTEWFVRMRFPGYKEAKFVKGVPTWDVITFGDIAFFIKGMNPNELLENYVQGHKLYVNIEAIEGGKVTYCNDKRTVDVNDDEVVMIMDGSRSGVVLKSKAGVLGSTLSVIRPKKGFEDFGSYIFYFLKQNFDWIESNNVGSAIPHANRKFIQKLSLLKPPVDLIKKFEEVAKPMEKQIEVLTQQNTQLRQIRDRLLPRLISGKLEVKANIINPETTVIG